MPKSQAKIVLMNKFFIVVLSAFLVSCKDAKVHVPNEKPVLQTANSEETGGEFEIIPGKSIGRIAIGDNAEALSSLGNPDMTDSAMGKSWATWYSKDEARNELNVFTTYLNDELKGKVVTLIRVTSPEFKVKNGIGPGSSSEEILKFYPKTQIVASFYSTNKKSKLAESNQDGIAFEMLDGICTAVIVHGKNTDFLSHYSTLHPDLKRL